MTDVFLYRILESNKIIVINEIGLAWNDQPAGRFYKDILTK
jgi:hypothetical protein